MDPTNKEMYYRLLNTKIPREQDLLSKQNMFSTRLSLVHALGGCHYIFSLLIVQD